MVTIIRKAVPSLRPAPHLIDHSTTAAGFSWDAARQWLDGLLGGAGLNIAHEAVDWHLLHGRGDQITIRWIGKSGERQDLSCADLAKATNQFANAPHRLGVMPGERMFVLMGRLP